MMAMTREDMDRKIDEHFAYEATDDVEGVLATLHPTSSTTSSAGRLGRPTVVRPRAPSMRQCSPTCRRARSRA